MFDDDVRDLGHERTRVVAKQAARLIEPTRLAVLDLGSNSFHLVVAALTDDGRFTVLDRSKERVQLGESVFDKGRISDDAFSRGVLAVRVLVDLAREHRPHLFVAVATSAIREARNAREFLRAIGRSTGIEVDVIDGLEEARLVCLGARRGLDLGGRRSALIDFGGGSTEVVVSDDRRCQLTTTLPLGAMRLRSETELRRNPRRADLQRLEERVEALFAATATHVRRVGFDVAVLSCGTARKLLKLARHDAPRLTVSTLRDLEAKLIALDHDERVALLGARKGSADTLLPGAIALRVMLEQLGASEALVSSTGLREGVIVHHLAKLQTASIARFAAS